jgi:hypothetical protein
MRFAWIRSIAAVVALGAAAATAAAGSYTFTTVTPPDITGVALNGVSASGVAVGTGLDSSGNVVSFLYSGGTFSTINFPGSTPGSTTVTAINGGGQYVGFYTDSSSVAHGFISVGGALQTFDSSQPGLAGTVLNGISNNGNLVGLGPAGGFLFSKGTFTPVSAPPGNAPPPVVGSFTFPNGVNKAGDVVGTVLTEGTPVANNQFDGFLLRNGQYSTIDFPGARGTEVFGINDSGVAVGTYANPDNSFHGFIYQNGVYTTVDNPNEAEGFGLGTDLLGINDAGVLAGGYTDATGNFIAFFATPTAAVPEPGSLALLSVVGLAVAARRLRKRG